LGRKGFIAFLAFLSAFVPLSTDLYLPALPGMTRYFGVPEYQTNLTLILFFVFFAAATLVWGPLSDRYGRRPVLLIGLTCYMVAGALCAVATDIFQLIGFRVLQAIGAGSAVALATAIIKDVWTGRKRETTIALVQSMVVISPAVAPVIGALLLRVTSWRGVFVVQALLGVLVLAGAIAFQETIKGRNQGNALASLRRLGTVLTNRTFRYLLVVFSLLTMPGMAFIASSSYIYEDTFGVSSQVYSLFFALNAAGLALGPPIYVQLSRRWKRTDIMTGSFVVFVLSGVLILFLGRLGPWPMVLALLPGSVAMSVMRPPASYLMLAQHDADAGTASSLMGASSMIMGSLGMVFLSLQLADKIRLIGLLDIGFGLLCGILWVAVARPRVLCAGQV
jgi:DHA1 family bicyclomycin/chloramphenicol resistance-like MFS transporter